jgi:hypothetical protein
VRAGRCLPGQFGAALVGDLLDNDEVVSILVRGEETFQEIDVRFGAHDRIVVRLADWPGQGSLCGFWRQPRTADGRCEASASQARKITTADDQTTGTFQEEHAFARSAGGPRTGNSLGVQAALVYGPRMVTGAAARSLRSTRAAAP